MERSCDERLLGLGGHLTDISLICPLSNRLSYRRNPDGPAPARCTRIMFSLSCHHCHCGCRF